MFKKNRVLFSVISCLFSVCSIAAVVFSLFPGRRYHLFRDPHLTLQSLSPYVQDYLWDVSFKDRMGSSSERLAIGPSGPLQNKKSFSEIIHNLNIHNQIALKTVLNFTL